MSTDTPQELVRTTERERLDQVDDFLTELDGANHGSHKQIAYLNLAIAQQSEVIEMLLARIEALEGAK